MAAGTQSSSHHPVAGAAGLGRAAAGGQTRLPWWALVLPAVAFAVLLAMITGAPEAHAAGGELSGLAQLLEQVRDALFAGAA